jgi:hypothetical protein
VTTSGATAELRQMPEKRENWHAVEKARIRFLKENVAFYSLWVTAKQFQSAI